MSLEKLNQSEYGNFRMVGNESLPIYYEVVNPLKNQWNRAQKLIDENAPQRATHYRIPKNSGGDPIITDDLNDRILVEYFMRKSS